MKNKPQKRKRTAFRSPVSFGGSDFAVGDLARAVEADPRGFFEKSQRLIDSGDLSFQNIRDLKAFFLRTADLQVPVEVEIYPGYKRTVMASAFSLLTSGMMVKALNDQYDEVESISDLLVEEIEDNKKVTTMAGVLSEAGDVKKVAEGEDFPIIGAGEEKYQILHNRNGRRLIITMEMIEENDTAGILQRINALGAIYREFREEQALDRVCDRHGSAATPAEPYVLRPSGGPVSLFQTNNNTLTRLHASGNRVVNNPLTNEDNLEALRVRLAGAKNSRGRRISVPRSELVLLVPDALVNKALKILRSEYVPGVENEINPWGPRGLYQPRLISSPKLDDISTTAYYFGAPRKQFKRKIKLRVENVTLTGNTQEFLNNRMAYQSRVAWDEEYGATDYVFWYQSLSGTTPPAV